jgi:hypothetical protein
MTDQTTEETTMIITHVVPIDPRQPWEALGAEVDDIFRRMESNREELLKHYPEEYDHWAEEDEKDRARLRAITFALIDRMWPGYRGGLVSELHKLIAALEYFWEKRISSEDWAAEYERMEAERERQRALNREWAQEAEETIDACTEERHEEFERLVAAKGKEAAIKEFCARAAI